MVELRLLLPNDEAVPSLPGWCGERYEPHEAVQAPFRMPVRDRLPEAA